jgi:hypothetical protein
LAAWLNSAPIAGICAGVDAFGARRVDEPVIEVSPVLGLDGEGLAQVGARLDE